MGHAYNRVSDIPSPLHLLTSVIAGNSFITVEKAHLCKVQ